MGILDTQREESFERVTSLVARLFNAPIVQVSLVDENREWFKAQCGITETQGSRQVAFCAYTILTHEVLIVEDALKDERFHDSPLVQKHGIRFYAGAPLRTAKGLNLGALCLKDRTPRTFTPEQAAILKDFAAIVTEAMENRLLAQKAQVANEIKSHFLAQMSHELRTPLNAIIGYSEMLLEDAADADDGEQDAAAKDLRKILSAGKHLLTLINDVLDLSKLEAGKMELCLESFNVHTMVQDVVATVNPLVEKNKNRLEVKCAPNSGSMFSDLTKVRQCLINLLSNAAKFTENGVITLEAVRETVGNGDTIRFFVKDNGIGISEEQGKKLFEAFAQADTMTTRKYGGTGLGLALSRKFCRMLGGDVSIVNSTPGQGTTFGITLPAKSEDTQEAPQCKVHPSS